MFKTSFQSIIFRNDGLDFNYLHHPFCTGLTVFGLQLVKISELFHLKIISKIKSSEVYIQGDQEMQNIIYLIFK